MPKHKPPIKSEDMPVTQSVLNEFRQEIKHDMTSIKLEVKQVESHLKQVESHLKQVESQVKQVEHQVKQVESQVKQVESRLESKIETVLSVVHRTHALIEEQNSRNRYVLDGYTSLNDRLDNHENEIQNIKKTLDSF